VEARYERQAWQIQHQINQLQEERADRLRSVAEAETSLQGTPRLRDRNKFFNSLLNGELDRLERVRPLWQKLRRGSREADRIEKRLADKETEIWSVVRRGLEHGDSWYQARMAELSREGRAQGACREMLGSIRAARKRINQADKRDPRDEASRSAADQAAREVSKLIHVVRRHAAVMSRSISSLHSFDSTDALRLDTEFQGVEHKVRVQKYKDTTALLDSIERSLDSLLRKIAPRQKSIEAQMLERVENQRRRFDETTSP
jgi:hypothetical protein